MLYDELLYEVSVLLKNCLSIKIMMHLMSKQIKWFIAVDNNLVFIVT